jgi:hypothetical protein
MLMSRAAVALIASIAAAGAASAHHGFGTFDLNEDIALEGTLTGIDFVNPHSWLYLDVEEADGATTSYRCEMRGATVLRRSGWSKDMFTLGERISVTGAPDRRDPNSCYLGTLTFASGASMDRYGQLAEAAPPDPVERPARADSGEPNIYGDWAPEQVVMTDPRGIVGTLVPLSTAESFEPGQVPEGAAPFPGSRGADPSLRSFATTRVPLTPRGQALADGYEDLNPEKNPRMRCESTSILFDWTFDGMIHRIAKRDGAVVITYGQYGLERTILMDAEHPAEVEPSRAGHSVGRWDGDVLLVDTVGFAPGILYPPLHHGEGLHVVERYTLEPETMALRRTYTAEDPDYFFSAFEGADVVLPSPLPHAPDECLEQSFINYAEESQAEPATKPWWRFWE